MPWGALSSNEIYNFSRRGFVRAEADYINTAMHVARPKEHRTGQPLEVAIVCVTPSDLEHDANERLDPDGDITADVWFQDMPQQDDKLTAEACVLLVEAAKDPTGTILRITGGIGISTTTFQTNGRVFGEEGGSRSEAAWEAALARLEQLGLVRDKGYKRTIFKLTDAGYKVADAIGPDDG